MVGPGAASTSTMVHAGRSERVLIRARSFRAKITANRERPPRHVTRGLRAETTTCSPSKSIGLGSQARVPYRNQIVNFAANIDGGYSIHLKYLRTPANLATKGLSIERYFYLRKIPSITPLTMKCSYTIIIVHMCMMFRQINISVAGFNSKLPSVSLRTTQELSGTFSFGEPWPGPSTLPTAGGSLFGRPYLPCGILLPRCW